MQRSDKTIAKGSSERLAAASGVNSVEEDFQEIVDRLYKPVLNYFARNGVPRDQRGDLTQETFLRAYRGFEAFRGDAKVTTWIFRIANHVLQNARRDQNAAKRRGSELSLEGAEDAAQPFFADGVFTTEGGGYANPLKSMLDEELARLLRDSLQSLPPQMQYCVLLRLQDLKYREIAAVQKISVETVKAHLFQARKRLKELLGEYFEQMDFGGNHEED